MTTNPRAKREDILRRAAEALCDEGCDHHQADAERMLVRIGFFELLRAAEDVVESEGSGGPLVDLEKALTLTNPTRLQ